MFGKCVRLCVCVYVCLSVCIFVCVYARLSVCMCLCVCLPVGRTFSETIIVKINFLIYVNSSPSRLLCDEDGTVRDAYGTVVYGSVAEVAPVIEVATGKWRG